MQVKTGICGWLAWLLRMQRPGKTEAVKTSRVIDKARMRDIELRERSSRSLLANVLDMDDDFRGQSGGASDFRHNHHHHHHANSVNTNNHCTTRSNSYHGARGKDRSSNGTPVISESRYGLMGNHAPPAEPYDAMTSQSQQSVLLRDLLCELRFLTDKQRKADDFDEQSNDWKFAALVIDRFCLWIFSLFTLVSTCAILFSAPHLFDSAGP